MSALLPDVWPWELIWPAALGVAIATLFGMLWLQLRWQRAVRWQQWALVACCMPFLGAPFLLFNNLVIQLQRPATIAETSPQATDPCLRTRVFRQSPEVTFATAVQVVQRTPFWRLTLQDPASGIIKVETSVALGLFTSDVLIHVDPAGDGGSQVNLRASSRLTEGDWGMSIRQIAIFYHRLDLALAQ